MTLEEQKIFRIKAIRAGYSVQEINDYLSSGDSLQDRARVAAEKKKLSTPVLTPKKDFGGPLDIIKGAYKGAANTIGNLGTMGQKALDTIAKPITEAVTGQSYQQTQTLNQALEGKITPNNSAQKLGFGAEKVGEYFIPGAAGIKAAKGASLISKVGTAALDTALTTTAQGGSPKDIATLSGISAAIPIVGKLSSIIATPVKKVLAEKISPALLNKYVIRPVAKDFHFGKDPGLGVAKEGLKANTREGLLTQIITKKKLLGNEIDTVLKKPEYASKQIDIRSALAGIDKKIARAAEEGEELLYSRLTKIREGITGKYKIVDGKAVKVAERNLRLTPLEAAQLKRKVGNATKWTGQAFDQEANQARVEIYRALNEMVDKAAPGSKALNARYANIFTAEKALDNTINVAKRQYPLGLINAGIGATGAGASLISGDSAPEAIVKGLVIATGARALQSTAVQSRIAAKLAQYGPEQRTIIAKAIPLLKNLMMGISQSETEEREQPQEVE